MQGDALPGSGDWERGWRSPVGTVRKTRAHGVSGAANPEAWSHEGLAKAVGLTEPGLLGQDPTLIAELGGTRGLFGAPHRPQHIHQPSPGKDLES